jgi:hypothetical protein
MVVKSEKRNYLGDSGVYAKIKLNDSLKCKILSCVLLSASLSVVCIVVSWIRRGVFCYQLV